VLLGARRAPASLCDLVHKRGLVARGEPLAQAAEARGQPGTVALHLRRTTVGFGCTVEVVPAAAGCKPYSAPALVRAQANCELNVVGQHDE